MIGSYALTLGDRQYREALADSRMRQIQPGLIMRPFHEQYPNIPQEWHVYCERHPEFGFCGPEWAASEAALEHGRKCESAGPTDGKE